MRHHRALAATAAAITLALIAHAYLLDGLHGIVWSHGLNEDTVYAAGYSDSAFRSVRIGMSKEQVRALLGEPLEAWTPYSAGAKQNPDLGWRWSRSAHDSNYRCRVILFGKGIVAEKHSEFYVD